MVVTSGFDLFPAELKEEYGYKIYDNVYTTVDVERMFRNGGIRTADGRIPKTIAFLHCVGSRDEKVNQRHCSRVCCITGVKQAIEMKQAIPDAEVYSFYMDMRMFGPGYEELYRQAQQEFNIHFIRGRISEASQTIDNRVQIKAEDTLIGLPLKMTVDMLVLIVGMKAGACNLQWSRCNGRRPIPQRIRQAERSVYREASTRGRRISSMPERSRRRKTSGSRSTKPSPPHTGMAESLKE